nr:hypothetical protein [uncultured Methanoregula sp.]
MHAGPVQEFTALHESMAEPGQPAVCMPPADFRTDESGSWKMDCGSSVQATELFMLQDLLLRAVRLNASLRSQGVDTTHADELVLDAARLSEEPGAQPSGKTMWRNDPDSALLGTNISQLRHAYRRILVREDLTPAIAKEVLTMAQQLDKIAGSLGYY